MQQIRTNPYRRHITIVSLIEIISLIFLIIGIILLNVGKKNCDSGCVERSCLAMNYNYYPCDCGSVCKEKTALEGSVYSLGASLLIIGIIGSVISCILLCVYRRRYYYFYSQPPIGETVIIAQQPVGFVQPQPQIPIQFAYLGGQNPAVGIPFGQPMPPNQYPYPQNNPQNPNNIQGNFPNDQSQGFPPNNQYQGYPPNNQFQGNPYQPGAYQQVSANNEPR